MQFVAELSKTSVVVYLMFIYYRKSMKHNTSKSGLYRPQYYLASSLFN